MLTPISIDIFPNCSGQFCSLPAIISHLCVSLIHLYQAVFVLVTTSATSKQLKPKTGNAESRGRRRQSQSYMITASLLLHCLFLCHKFASQDSLMAHCHSKGEELSCQAMMLICVYAACAASRYMQKCNGWGVVAISWLWSTLLLLITYMAQHRGDWAAGAGDRSQVLYVRSTDTVSRDLCQG